MSLFCKQCAKLDANEEEFLKSPFPLRLQGGCRQPVYGVEQKGENAWSVHIASRRPGRVFP